MTYYSIKLCARAGGQALGLEKADFEHIELVEIDLLAGGVPCPPFSVAGKQLGSKKWAGFVPKSSETG